MGAGVDIRIDAHGNRGAAAQEPGARLDAVEFRCAFDIEAFDAGLDGKIDLDGGFADAGENDLGRRTASAHHPFEFAAGDDVEAGA